MRSTPMPGGTPCARRAPLLVILLLLGSHSWAAAPDLEFRPPPAPGDAATPAAMRDLAERLLPIYQEPDPDRYLQNLSALQMVDGNYAAADATRQTLRERRRREDEGRPVGKGVIYDTYARAKAMEAQDRVSFADAFAKSYRELLHG